MPVRSEFFELARDGPPEPPEDIVFPPTFGRLGFAPFCFGISNQLGVLLTCFEKLAAFSIQSLDLTLAADSKSVIYN